MTNIQSGYRKAQQRDCSKGYYCKHKEQINAQQRMNYARKKAEQGETVRKAKPKAKKEVCNMDCFNCIYPDCIKS